MHAKPEPYLYTDGHNHQLRINRTTDALDRPRVVLAADNLAIGGDLADVWLDPDGAQRLTDALYAVSPFEHTDHMGDRLDVTPGEPYTTFTLTRAPRDDDEKPAAVPVVVLTARLPEMRRALAALLDNEPPAAPRTATAALHEAIRRIDDTPQDYELDPGRGDALAVIRALLAETEAQAQPKPSTPTAQ